MNQPVLIDPYALATRHAPPHRLMMIAISDLSSWSHFFLLSRLTQLMKLPFRPIVHYDIGLPHPQIPLSTFLADTKI